MRNRFCPKGHSFTERSHKYRTWSLATTSHQAGAIAGYCKLAKSIFFLAGLPGNSYDREACKHDQKETKTFRLETKWYFFYGLASPLCTFNGLTHKNSPSSICTYGEKNDKLCHFLIFLIVVCLMA